MKNKNYPKARAYDEARKEFYRHRHLEDVRRRIAKEEALHVGAYFNKGAIEIGMELEDKSFESWKAWATREIDEEQAMRAQMFTGAEAGSEGPESKLTSGELEEAVEEAQDVIPGSKEGQSALGGSVVHP